MQYANKTQIYTFGYTRTRGTVKTLPRDRLSQISYSRLPCWLMPADLRVSRSVRRKRQTCWGSSPSDRLFPRSSCSPAARCWRWCGGTAAPAAPPSLRSPATKEEVSLSMGQAETTRCPVLWCANGGNRNPHLTPPQQCEQVFGGSEAALFVWPSRFPKYYIHPRGFFKKDIGYQEIKCVF